MGGKELCVYWVSAKGGHGQGSDELGTSLSQGGSDLKTKFLKAAAQIQGFVCGDTSTNANMQPEVQGK
jgi:hypothetical protein